MLARCELSPSKSGICIRRVFFHYLTQGVFSFAGLEFKSERSHQHLIFGLKFLLSLFFAMIAMLDC